MFNAHMCAFYVILNGQTVYKLQSIAIQITSYITKLFGLCLYSYRSHITVSTHNFYNSIILTVHIGQIGKSPQA